MRLAALVLLAASAALASGRVDGVDVRVGGIGHTRPSAVRRLMTTQQGDDLDLETLERDLARLRATGIFYDVSGHTVESPEGKHVELTLKDRWTLMPVIGVRRGGGRTTSRIGLVDHNAFGRLFSVYGEISSNADVPFIAKKPDDRYGSLVYVRVPRLFGTRLTPMVQWSRDFLDFSSFGPAPHLYDRSREEVRAEARYELTDLVSAIGAVAFERNLFSPSSLSQSPGPLPPSANTTWFSAGVQLGLVQDLLSLSDGTQLDVVLSRAQRGLLGSSATVSSAFATLRSFAVLGPGTGLGGQLTARATTGTTDAYLFRAGGLKEIRGFPDSYFQARQVVSGNVELRRDLFRSRFGIEAINQAAAFVDFGWIGDRANAVAGIPYTGPVASAGIGLRWIPIPFARAVGRIDVAMGMYPERRFDISLGGQQFF
ncbi:MAG: POTRA domain-containing protein [Myxococcales bacterium]